MKQFLKTSESKTIIDFTDKEIEYMVEILKQWSGIVSEAPDDLKLFSTKLKDKIIESKNNQSRDIYSEIAKEENTTRQFVKQCAIFTRYSNIFSRPNNIDDLKTEIVKTVRELKLFNSSKASKNTD